MTLFICSSVVRPRFCLGFQAFVLENSCTSSSPLIKIGNGKKIWSVSAGVLNNQYCLVKRSLDLALSTGFATQIARY